MKQHFLPEEMTVLKKPEELGLVYCSAQRIEIKGSPVTVSAGDEELCFICIGGACEYASAGLAGTVKCPDMLYVPLHGSVTLSGGEAVFMRYGAPCSKEYAFSHIRYEDVDKDDRHKVYGKKENCSERDVWNFITDKFPSGRFLTGVCFGRDGGWTAWPPHEHGKEREEVYVYFGMGDDFGIQCVYDDFEHPNAYIVRDGHFVTIPGGYHPNCGCPHGPLKYAFCMVSTTEGDRNFMDLRTQKIYGDKLE